MSSSEPRPESAQTVAAPSVPALLTWCTWAAVVLVAAQLVLGILMLNGSWSLVDAHAGLGYLATLGAVVAAISAIVWKRRGGSTGIMAHAVSMPVLMIIQIGLGSAGVKWVHVVLGVLILVGLLGLPMSLRSASRRSA